MSKLAAIARASAPIARDLVGLSGIGLFIAGVATFSVPIAMMVGGLILIGLAALWAAQSA